jgi:uncharacterized membrane protein (DUF106 family)
MSSSQHTTEKSNMYSSGLRGKTKLQQDKIDEHNKQQREQQHREQQEQKEQADQEKININNSASSMILYLFFLIFMSVWIIVTIYAIVKSFICAGKSGTTAEKIIGIFLAIFLGPFYLIYLSSMDGYCKDSQVM